MSEAVSAPGVDSSAGALLRAARERQGLHIAALAAAIKIPQRKLEALEADRVDELPDAAFARALAMTVCRALKIDAAPVLEKLPPLGSAGLADVRGGLKAPFRERPGRAEPGELHALRHPLAWAALAVLVAAAALLLLPAGWWQGWFPDAAPEASVPATPPAASVPASAAMTLPAAAPAEAAASAAPTAVSAASVEVVHSVPAADGSASAVADAASGVAVLRALDASWVEVIDAGGQVLVQRTLQPGETLGLDGRLPLKLKIGNSAGTVLQFRGQAVDLGPVTRDNIARLELK